MWKYLRKQKVAAELQAGQGHSFDINHHSHWTEENLCKIATAAGLIVAHVPKIMWSMKVIRLLNPSLTTAPVLSHALASKRVHRQHFWPEHFLAKSNGIIMYRTAKALKLDPNVCTRSKETIKDGAEERQTTYFYLYPPTKLEGGSLGVSSRAQRRAQRDVVPSSSDEGEQGPALESTNHSEDDDNDLGGPTPEEIAETEAFSQMCDEFKGAAREYLQAIGDDRAQNAAYLKRIAAACARCAKEGGDRTLSWEWLRLNPGFVTDFTMFESVESMEHFFEWLDLKGGLTRMRVVTAEVRRKKRESSGGLGSTPSRKNEYSPRFRGHTALDVFFACNYLIRTGCRVSALAKMFGVISKSHRWFMDRVYSTLWFWCHHLQARFKPELLSKRRVQNRAPPSYTKHFHNRIRRIIDGLPFYTEMASSRRLRRAMYNKYYGKAAVKALVGCTPFGSCDFISDLFCARIDDEAICEASGCLDTIPQGMDVAADKGFYISKALFRLGCGLVQPVEKPRGKRYSRNALLYSRRVSRHRIHVERWVRRIQSKSGWLQRRIPMSQLHLIYPMVQVCALMGNLRVPLSGGDVLAK
jgi:hypothetical protein